MPWFFYLGHFVGGYALVNGIPHFVQGVSGNRFQSPFGKPPGVGESGPVSNVAWGVINFAIAGYLLLALRLIDVHEWHDWGLAVVAGLLASLRLSTHLGRVRSHALRQLG